MAVSTNPAVRKACEAGTYTDARGTPWRRGVDGWFDESDSAYMLYMIHHRRMIKKIERENP